MQTHRSSNEEVQWQEQVALTFNYFDDLCAAAADYSLRMIRPHLKGKTLLEIGPADGYMTRGLSDDFDLTLVEPSETFCNALQQTFPHATVVCGLAEDVNLSGRFDNILLCHVLDHVRDPGQVVSRAASWLAPSGRMIAIAPNCNSLHRQAAVRMGLLPAANSFSERDQAQGKRRIFSRPEFKDVFERAGLRIDFFGGYWLKPLSNGQIERQWTREMIEAFFALGESHPEIAAEMCIVAGRS